MRIMTPAAAILGLLAIGMTQTATAAPDKTSAPVPASCSAEQLAVIDAAYALARTRIAEAIAFLDANPQHPHVRRFFADVPRKLVRLNLTLTQATLQPGQRARVQCGAPSCSNGDGGENFGTADREANRIAFCPAFFRAREEGRDARYGVVIHEASHIAATTRDAAYYPEGTEALAKDHPEITPMNAESLELFVELLPR